MIDPIDAIRALAARALEDCRAEQQSAALAMARADAHLDKHHELMALAQRLSPGTFKGCTIKNTRQPDITLGGVRIGDD